MTAKILKSRQRNSLFYDANCTNYDVNCTFLDVKYTIHVVKQRIRHKATSFSQNGDEFILTGERK